MLILSFVSSLIFFNLQLAEASSRNCIIVLVGGGIEYRNDPDNLDSAQKWLDQSRFQAQRTGCRVVEQANQSKEEFTRFISDVGKSASLTTKIHFTFTDHGAPQPLDNPLDGQLVIGKGKRIRMGEFFDTLKSTFPSQHLTFDSSICHANLNGALVEFNKTNRLNMCGASSVQPVDKSSNQVDRTVDAEGNIRAFYSGLSLEVMAQKVEDGLNPTVVDTHLSANRADRHNTPRRQGTTTSIEYARSVLVSKGHEDILAISPLGYFAREQGIPAELWRQFENPNEDFPFIENWSQFWTEDYFRARCQLRPLGVSLIDQIRQSLNPDIFSLKYSVNVPEEVPGLNWRVRGAKRSLVNNHDKIKKEIIRANLMRQSYYTSRVSNATDISQNAEIRKQWTNLNANIRNFLAPFASDMRVLQEAKVRQDFLKLATPEQRRIFHQYQACETMPAL